MKGVILARSGSHPDDPAREIDEHLPPVHDKRQVAGVFSWFRSGAGAFDPFMRYRKEGSA